MQATGKAFGRKLVETSPNVEMKARDQESLDNLLRHTIGKDSIFSFSRAADSPVQWIHWLDTFDQQNGSKVSKGLKVEVGVDTKDGRQGENSESENTSGDVNGLRDSMHASMKGNGVFGRGLQSSQDRMHSLKIPEAVVAFAQAAAKANDLPGWPLMSPSKVQMQKCDKCSGEFCSPLNYRRHIRMHRRPLNVDKEDLRKERMQLAAFWDKLTLEEASSIVSFKNLELEDLSGSAVVGALGSFLRQPGLPSLPQSYLKAGKSLLDFAQNKAFGFPLPSEELLIILDDSSEKTFLCGVVSISMQRFIFEGEATKVGLETKNLVASLGLLIEQRLVKAWMADKDAKALRCQKALVEEEEAAQMKRAKLQERKRLKKMRQKEMKDKERKGTESASSFQMLDIDLNGANRPGNGEGGDSPTATQSSPSSAYSGQDLNHTESVNIELNDFDVYVTGNVDNMFLRLVDEESLEGDDDHHGIAWKGTSNHVKRKADVEGAADSLSRMIELRENAASAAIDGNMEVLEASSQVEVQETTEYHNSYLSQKMEHGKPFMEFKMRGPGRFSNRKVVAQDWRERKRYEANECNSFQKANYGGDVASYQKYSYGTDRRFYDNSSQHNQKVTRKPYNMAGNFSQDFPVTPSLPKTSLLPRYGQYRDKSQGLRRTLPLVGNGHAVWTKKVQQISISESEKVGISDGDSKLGNTENCSGSMGLSGSECESSEAGRVLGTLRSGSCVGKSHVFGNNSTASTSINDARTHSWRDLNDKSDGTFSCDSSVSNDSGSQSSVSASARIGAEEQVGEGVGAINSLSGERTACPLRHVGSEGSNISSWGSVEACSPEIGDALYIGSLSIPLGDLAGVFSSRSQDKFKWLSKDINSLPIKNPKGATGGGAGSSASVGEVTKDQGSLTPLEVDPKESITDDECELAPGEMLGDFYETENESKPVQSGANDTADVSHHIGSQASMQEKLVKQASWPNGVNKIGTVRVWRPVGVVEERQEALTNGQVSGLDNMVICTGDKCSLDVTSNGVVDHREMESSDCIEHEDNVTELYSQSVGNTTSNEDEACLLKVRLNGDERFAESCGYDRLTMENEAISIHSFEADDVEVGSRSYEAFNSKLRAGDASESALSWHESKLCLPFPDVASFLSQRWADAVGAYESSVMGILAADSQPSTMSSSGTDLSYQAYTTVSLSNADEGKPYQNEESSLCRACNSQEQALQVEGFKVDLRSETSACSETEARQHLSCDDKIGDLMVGTIHPSSGNTANKTVDLAMAQASDKSGDSGSLSGIANRWHQNPRSRVLEPRYMPRQRDFEERS